MDHSVLICTLIGHDSYISDICIDNSNQYMVSTATDGTLKVWNLNSQRQIFSTSSRCSFQNCMIYSRDGITLALFSISAEGFVYFWELKITKDDHWQVKAHDKFDLRSSVESSIVSYSASPDGALVTFVNSDRKIWVYSRYKESYQSSFITLEETPACSCYNRSSGSFLIGTKEGGLYHVYLLNGIIQFQKVYASSFSIDFMKCFQNTEFAIISSANSQNAVLYNTASLVELSQILLDSPATDLISCSSANSILVLSKNVIYILTLLNETVTISKIASGRTVLCASLSPDNFTLITSDDSGRFFVYSNCSSSKYSVVNTQQFFDFEQHEIIFDEHGYSISAQKRTRIENLLPNRLVDINLGEIFEESVKPSNEIDSTFNIQTSNTECTLNNGWLLSCEPSFTSYIPQIYDRVVINVPELLHSISLSNFVANLYNSQPVTQSLFQNKLVIFGTIVAIEFVEGPIDNNTVGMKIDVAVVNEFSLMDLEEIPLSKIHVNVLYDLTYPHLCHAIMRHDRYASLINQTFTRGERLVWVSGWNQTKPVIVIGESRRNIEAGIKVRTKDGITHNVPQYAIFSDNQNYTIKEDFKIVCRLLAKKVKILLKTTKYQKSLNYVDYILEGKDDQLRIVVLYPITITIIVKRLENGFYSRSDSIMFDLDHYLLNLSKFPESLVSLSELCISNIRSIVKTSLKPRNKR